MVIPGTLAARLGLTTHVSLLRRKLMRDAPVDHADAQFIVRSAGLSPVAVNDAIRCARVPVDVETRDAFAAASTRLRAWLAARAGG
ncbi:MAG: hypothetical protein A3K19_31535 [Lentisphaerae bacterium RIFOXYB12_FULL_65_16]|nr:MAG: hypothetical protein A3K18_27610 [Lentisphaerae bacterium RIFOXYA12_64_32]OGV88577.1 MAG: hypothetical protein A3K19_31535 [Lentisphaerae bacterium RIFOXYB12_FULL_65_16]